MAIREIGNFGDYEFAKKMSSEGIVYVMKHSLTCPISSKAYSVFTSFAKVHEDIPCFIVKIQESKSVSDRIAQDTGITHESPQVIVFKNTEPIWNDSHFHITKVNLNNVLKNN